MKDSLPFVSLPGLVRLLWHHKWPLFWTVAVVTGLTAVIALQLPPRYTAEARIMIDPRSTNIVDEIVDVFNEDVYGEVDVQLETINSEVEILRSRRLMNLLVERLDLANYPEFIPRNSVKSGHPKIFAGFCEELPNIAHDDNQISSHDNGSACTSLTDQILDVLQVEPRPRSFVIAIRFVANDPRLAADLVNTLVDLYIADQLEAKLTATRRLTAWLDDRLSDLSERVQHSEAAVEQYRAEIGLIEGQDTTILAEQISEINSELVAARADFVEKNAILIEMSKLVESDGLDSTALVLNSPLIQDLRTQEAEIASELAELASEYGPRHPVILNLQAELAELRRKIDDEIRKIAEGLQGEVNAARARMNTLSAELKRLTDATQTRANHGEIRLTALESEAAAAQTLYETFLKRFQETSELAAVAQPDARVISYASTPQDPSAPNRPLIIAAAFVVSTLVAGLFVVAVEQFRQGFQSAREVQLATSVPALAVVPELKGLPFRRPKPATYVIEHPNSSYAEALRNAYFSLRLRDSTAQTILVTSALPSEGKTTFAVSLGRLVAQMEERVLLIDCDVRRPAIHRLLTGREDQGLADLLNGRTPIQSVLMKDRLSDLHFITSGTTNHSIITLLGSERMLYLLSKLKQHYSLILLDTPPATCVPDTRILSRLSDTTVFITQWRRTPRDVVIHSVRVLLDDNVPVSGIFLSRANLSSLARYEYGSSKYRLNTTEHAS